MSRLPDLTLNLANSLPAPANKFAFSALRRFYKLGAKLSPRTIDIDFGAGVHIQAPLEHPSVYWRYRPATANRNFLMLGQLIAEHHPGLFIDVGANIGDGAALLRSHGVEQPLLLVEGSARWFELMQANTRGFSRITCVQAMLGEEEVHIKGQLDESRGTGKVIAGAGEMVIRTLDSVVAEAGSGVPPTYLKTDTDGFDVKVLRGATGIMTRHQPVIFAECADGLLGEQGDCVSDMFALAHEHGYSEVAIWDHQGGWIGMRSVEQGVADLLGKFPGGPQEAFLDVAFLAPKHQPVHDALVMQPVA